MTHLALCRFRAVLDLGEQFRLYPDALVRDALGVGLCLTDQRRETLAQFIRRFSVKPVIDFTGIDEVIAFAAADVDAIPVIAIERKASDSQRLALSAGYLDPVAAAPGKIAVSRTLETTPSSPTLQAWANISLPSISKLSLN
jgi:hypothetical protein